MKTLVHLCSVAAIFGMLCLSTGPALAAGTTITVNTTDGTGAADGKCSLPEAVDAANSGTAQDGGACPGGAGPYTISFNIPGSGLHAISLTSQLTISSPMTIDGTTQPGYTGTPLIYANGTGLATAPVEIDAGASGTVLKALQFSGPNGDPLISVVSANSITISKSYLNTDGTQVLNTASSADFSTTSSSNDIIGGTTATDRNLFGGQMSASLSGGSNNLIQNNYMGLQANGLAELTGQPAANSAIQLGFVNGNTMTNNVVRGNVIGGFITGVELDAQVAHTTVAGNLIGVGADGTTTTGVYYGVALYGSSSNTIGGTTAADRNVIAEFNDYGISIANSGTNNSDGNLIEGNYIGPDATGLSAPHTPIYSGVDVENGNSNQIGGIIAGAGNLISGNNFGIKVGGTAVNTEIFGNLIGTDKNGANAIPNATGIYLNNAPAVIGNSGTPGNNVISGNSNVAADLGIDVSGVGTAGTTIFGNKLGINQAGSAAIPNDYAVYVENGGFAQITQNWIGNSTGYSIYVSSTSTVADSTLNNGLNCFTNNSAAGLLNTNTGVTAAFTSNWWGNATGPTHSGNPGGTGDTVSDHVDYSSFLTAAPPACSPLAGLSAPFLAFGNQLVGSSATKSITLTNVGGKVMTLTSINTAAPYSIDGTSTCPTGSGTLGSGASCSINVKFAPTAIGSAPGTVTITTDAGSSPDHVTLSGSGVAGTQLLKNASFEIDANNDKKPDNWALVAFNVATDGRDCTVKKSGLCSLKLVGNGAMKTASETILKNGIAGDDFTFSLFSRAMSVPAGATYRLAVYMYNGSTLIKSQVLNFTIGTHGFMKVAGGFAAPGPYTKLIFKITYKAASGSVWFDPASLAWAP